MKINLSLFWKEVSMFSLVQFFGIWSAFKLFPEFKNSFGQSGRNFSLFDLLVLAIFGLIFYFLLKRQSRGAGIFVHIFLIIAIFSGTRISLFPFLREIYAIALALLIVILFLFFKTVIMHNIAMILGIAGIGAVFGLSVSPMFAVFLLLALSFYDIIAVYWTKHMVKMAEGMVKTGNIFGIIIPENIKNFKLPVRHARPGQGFMILGSGDLAMPIILSASVAPVSLTSAFIVGVFAVLGLVLTHILFVGQKVRRPMAALPPIAVMSIVGYLITLIFSF